jgi:hypothetical protein
MKKLILAAMAITLLAVGMIRVELVAQPRPDAASKKAGVTVRNAEIAAKQKAMIDAARATYDTLTEYFRLGRQEPNEVYVWSSYLRIAEVRAANSPDQIISACNGHLERMKRLHAGVKALSDESARGGEADRLHATEFYVAEAELFLLEAKNKEHVTGVPPATK